MKVMTNNSIIKLIALRINLMNEIGKNTEGDLWMTPERSLKVGTNDKRKARRCCLLQKRKAEIESESVGLSDYRKMRLARSLYRTQTFCNSGRRRRTGSPLILETRLFIGKAKMKTGGRKNGTNPNPVAKLICQMTKMKITLGLKNGRTGSALIL